MKVSFRCLTFLLMAAQRNSPHPANPLMAFLWLVALGCGIALYFLPSIIARSRQKKNAGSIFVLNFFFGWTFIGWVLMLAWSVAKD